MLFVTKDQIHAYECAYVTPGHSLVYGLCDPHTKEVRYIGVTKEPRRRYVAHNSEARRGVKTHKCNWMRQVRRETGAWPIPAILDVVKDEAREEAERGLISENRLRIVNGTEGGEGKLGWKTSDETKAKISVAKSGKKQTPEHRAKGAASRRGTKRSPKTRDRMRAAQQARFKNGISEETLQQMSEAQQRRRERERGDV